jgi:hypothetical protein
VISGNKGFSAIGLLQRPDEVGQRKWHSPESNSSRCKTVTVAIALTFMELSSPFYIFAKTNERGGVYKVVVVEPISLSSGVQNMTGSKNSGDGDNGGEQNATPAKQPENSEQQPAAPKQILPAKPVGPPNTVFKGSFITTVKASSDGGGEEN